MSDAKTIDTSLLDDQLLAIYRKKSKTDEDQERLAPYWDLTLSAGAKTYILDLAKQEVYGYRPTIKTKEMAKGTSCEDFSIELYNSVFFTAHTKNTERREDEFLTGEADIVDVDSIKDIKTSWSLSTFPVLAESAKDADYEWQGRAYMRLWDKPFFELAFCLVTTPDELIGFEDPTLHYVDHIPAHMRVTKVLYKRDFALEMKIARKCESAQKLFEQYVEQIKKEHAQ